jgi:hypothetical protein
VLKNRQPLGAVGDKEEEEDSSESELMHRWGWGETASGPQFSVPVCSCLLCGTPSFFDVPRMLFLFIISRCLSSWVWWCTFIIPATWEAEIGRITVPGQPGQKVRESISTNEVERDS